MVQQHHNNTDKQASVDKGTYYII